VGTKRSEEIGLRVVVLRFTLFFSSEERENSGDKEVTGGLTRFLIVGNRGGVEKGEPLSLRISWAGSLLEVRATGDLVGVRKGVASS
jgi:hypothetical protein